MSEFLEVQNLRTSFKTEYGSKYAVDDVSFSVEKGKTLGVVGESGCGKSITFLSVLGLVPKPFGRIESGQILFEGENLLKKSRAEMQDIRGNRISMIFQEPMTSLNPVYTIGFQIMEAIRLHQKLEKKEAHQAAIKILKLVGISSPEQRIREYPFQLSGGMRQRAMIAMALSCNPSLLIADEPTTALDVTIQAQILELMNQLKARLNTTIILITHDLGVVAEMAQTVMVMYAGKVVEYGDVYSLFHNPLHPYTQGLLKSIPRLDQKKDSLYVIPGMVPNLNNMPKGCRFYPRCTKALPICKEKCPEKVNLDGQQVNCWLYACNKEKN